MSEQTAMSAIDFVFSVFPAAECFFASALMLWIFYAARQSHHKYLHVFFMFLGLFYLMSVFFYSRNYSVVAFSYVLSIPVTMAILPSYYLYLLSLTRKKSVGRSSQLLHYTPSLVLLFILFPFWLLPSEVQIAHVSQTLEQSESFAILNFIKPVYRISVLYLINIQFVVYIFLMMRELGRYRKDIEARFSFKEQITLEWMLYSILFFTLLIFLISFSHYLGVASFFYSRLIFNTLSAAIIFYLFIKGFTQRNVFMPFRHDENSMIKVSGINSSNPALIPTFIQNSVEPVETEAKIQRTKYAGSGLNIEKKQQLLDDLHKIMQDKKLFLNNQLDVDQLAEILDTNSTWLSQTINESLGKNFFNYINELRIEESKRLLTDPGNNKYTIEALAWNCGFNSRSSFHAAFKKYTGMTPAEYRKKN